jgi:cyclopropane-fatty-acyl-phospholipid synthase
MGIVHDLLGDAGLLLLHAIGARGSGGIGAWVDRYIFPNSELPRLADVVGAIDGLFVMEDWQNFGAYYDKTLMAWNDNVERHPAARALLEARGMSRTWRYYLLTCAGLFRLRTRTQLWQVVLSKRGVLGGYVSVR